MARVLLVALSALVLVAGCGDDSGEGAAEQREREKAAAGPAPTGTPEEQIQEIWRRYYTALAARKGDAACAQLTERGRDELVEKTSDAGGTCQEVVAVFGSFFEGYRSELVQVKVRGERATAVAPRFGEVNAQALEFVREDGRWKIDHAEESEEPAKTAGSEDEQIREVWRRYTKALGEEDGTAVCSLLTENGKEEVLMGGAAGDTCEEKVEAIGSFFKEFDVELTDIRVQGDVAEAVVPARGQIPKQGLTFQRVGGDWKIDRASDIQG